MLPNFLIVGAEKAGTTTLAATLAEHPQIFISSPKEPRFFSHQEKWNKRIKWYESLFEGASKATAVGEASPAYTWHPHINGVPRRIYETLGDIKYVYMVRHPVERLISHYRHALFCRWIDDDVTLEEAIRRKPRLIDCSRYYYQIEQYASYTRPDQWLVIALEELQKDEQAFLRRVFEFLGVDPLVEVSMRTKNRTDNKKIMPQWYLSLKWLSKLIVKRELASRLKQIVPVKAVENRIGKKIDRPAIPISLYTSLVCYFRNDVVKLSAWSGRNFKQLWEID